jgi:hypothetical protein
VNRGVFDIIDIISQSIKFHGPFLEVGSKRYDDVHNLRNIFNNGEYVGVDFQNGSGVDVVADAHSMNLERKFNTIICTSMLEHDSDIDATFLNCKKHLNKGGKGIFIIPFDIHIHGYPDDYQRLTPNGIKLYLKRHFDSVQGFGIGKKLIPHNTVGLVNCSLHDSVIDKINKKWPSDKGRLYYYSEFILPKFILHLIKYVMYGRFY